MSQLTVTTEEAKALRTLLGFVLLHTSEPLFQLALKLDKIVSCDEADYDSLVFYKNDEGGSPERIYKHSNISIGFK